MSDITSGMAVRVACSKARIKPSHDFCSSDPGLQKKKFENTRVFLPARHRWMSDPKQPYGLSDFLPDHFASNF